MTHDRTARFTIGISATALFEVGSGGEAPASEDLHESRRRQPSSHGDALSRGPGFPLAHALLRAGERAGRRVELVAMSKAGAAASPRLFASLQKHALPIARAALTGGYPLERYLGAFDVDLLLSSDEEEVRSAITAGHLAGLVRGSGDPRQPIDQIRIAFDGDAAILATGERDAPGASPGTSPESKQPETGPAPGHASLLARLAELQGTGDPEKAPIRTALLTKRASPSQERVVRALGDAGLRLDEAFFVGELPADGVLEAFGAHILFDHRGAHYELPDELVAADETQAAAEKDSARPLGRLRLRANG